MSKYHCVLDASTLLKKYHKEPGAELVSALFKRDDCALHVLNMTIPEVTGAFVRWQLGGEFKGSDRKKLLDLFIKDITEYRFVIHNITHRNVVDTDVIWDQSIAVPQPKSSADSITMRKCPNCKHTWEDKAPRFKRRVGPVDVLVVSVARELKRVYKEAYLFTVDEHMLNVATKFGIKTCNVEAVSKLPFN